MWQSQAWNSDHSSHLARMNRLEGLPLGQPTNPSHTRMRVHTAHMTAVFSKAHILV